MFIANHLHWSRFTILFWSYSCSCEQSTMQIVDWSSILNLQHLRRQGINKWQWRPEKSRKIRRMCKVESLCPLWALSIRKGFKCSFDQTNQIWSIKLVPWSHYKQLNILHEFKWKINNLLLYNTFFFCSLLTQGKCFHVLLLRLQRCVALEVEKILSDFTLPVFPNLYNTF